MDGEIVRKCSGVASGLPFADREIRLFTVVMPHLTFSLVLLIAYICLGPLTWSAYGHLMRLGRNKMRLLRRPPQVVPNPAPLATIVVPAKDEGERIRACLESCLNQDYSNFEVLAIDDRSTDQTGAVMDELAVSNPRLTVIHKKDPPPVGWTGKNHGLWTGQGQARGEWLLFVDSDVILEKDALSASMSVVIRKEFDMISLLPKVESHTIWESTLVPLAGAAASTMYLVALTNNNLLTKCAFANGQFLMISRRAYDAIGGHETVRDRFCEDVAIAKLVKGAGMRPRVSWGTDFAAVRMYSSLGAIYRGWSRIYYAASAGKPWRSMAAALFLIFCSFTAYFATLWGAWTTFHPIAGSPHWLGPAWLIAGGFHLAMMTFCLMLAYGWSGNPRRNALLFPIAGPMLLSILLLALKMCITKKVEWRGTSYAHKMAANLAAAPSGQN